jgi:hypothetical protein
MPASTVADAAAKAELLGNDAAAAYIGTAACTLPTWRSQNRGPTFIKVGRKVLYRRADLDAWLESRAVATSESAS